MTDLPPQLVPEPPPPARRRWILGAAGVLVCGIASVVMFASGAGAVTLLAIFGTGFSASLLFPGKDATREVARGTLCGLAALWLIPARLERALAESPDFASSVQMPRLNWFVGESAWFVLGVLVVLVIIGFLGRPKSRR